MIIYLATKNAHKRQELQQILSAQGMDITVKASPEEVASPEETGNTFEENAFIKAKSLAHLLDTDTVVLADDSGLEVDALGSAPGVHSARYAGEDATDTDNNKKLLEALKDYPKHARRARFVCALVLLKAGGEHETLLGHCEGRILDTLGTQGGFGYDPLFAPDGYEQSFAELGQSIKNRISHRARALQTLLHYLRKSRG